MKSLYHGYHAFAWYECGWEARISIEVFFPKVEILILEADSHGTHRCRMCRGAPTNVAGRITRLPTAGWGWPASSRAAPRCSG